MQAHWHLMFTANGIICDMLTHQPRRQGMQDADDEGIPNPSIERAVGHSLASSGGETGNQHSAKSYMTNPPVNMTVSRAGGDHASPESHVTGWVVEEIDDALLDLAMPALNPMVNQVTAKYNACRTQKQRDRKRLNMALGSITALRSNVWRALCMVAARPLNMKTRRLETDALPLYETFRSSGVKLLQLPVFDSDKFVLLVATVRLSQNLLDSDQVDLSVPAKNAIDRAVKERVTEPLKLLILLNRRQGFQIESLKESVQVLSNARGSAVAPAASSSPSDVANIRATTFAQAFGDVQLPANAKDDVLSDGKTTRKRKRPITLDERVVVAKLRDPVKYAELVAPGPDQNLTLKEYWNEYYHGTAEKTAYRVLEERTNKRWRQDLPHSNAFRQWWAKRSPIYNLIHYYIDNQGLTEELALAKANSTFKSVPVSTKSKWRRCLADVRRAFLKELDRIPAPKELRKYR